MTKLTYNGENIFYKNVEIDTPIMKLGFVPTYKYEDIKTQMNLVRQMVPSATDEQINKIMYKIFKRANKFYGNDNKYHANGKLKEWDNLVNNEGSENEEQTTQQEGEV